MYTAHKNVPIILTKPKTNLATKASFSYHLHLQRTHYYSKQSVYEYGLNQQLTFECLFKQAQCIDEMCGEFKLVMYMAYA